jgi:putative ABC transport system permease protein
MSRAAIVSAVRIAVRNLARHRGRTAMTLAAIAFGVVALVLSGGFIEDMFSQLREVTIQSRLGHVQISREGYSIHGRRDSFRYLIEDPRDLDAVLADDPRVASVSSRLDFQGLISNGRSDLPIVAEGVQVRKNPAAGEPLTLLAGRPFAPGDRFAVLAGEGVAQSMKLAPGDIVTLMVNTPGGALNTLDFRVAGIFRTFSKDFDDRAVRIPIDAARELLAVQGAHSIVVSLTETAATDAVAARLREALRSRGYEVRTWLELDDFYPKALALYQRQFGVLQLIVLAIVTLTVANSVNMTAFERQGEYGTIRALGVRGRGVFGMIMLENLLLGIVGAAIGLACGVLLALVISSVGIPMPPPPNSNSAYLARIQLSPEGLATAALIGAGATVVSSLYAAFRVSTTPIAWALRQNV